MYSTIVGRKLEARCADCGWVAKGKRKTTDQAIIHARETGHVVYHRTIRINKYDGAELQSR